VLRVAGLGLVVGLACSLPVEEKTACFTSADCVDDRLCDAGQCVPGGCGVTCIEVCERVVDDCELAAIPTDDCQAECVTADGLLPAFRGDQCKRQWDALAADDDCDVAQCLLDCRDLCILASECRLIVDIAACTIGCQEDANGCPTAAPSTCTDIPPTVQCYEAGRC
jgi:hypothetical protein